MDLLIIRLPGFSLLHSASSTCLKYPKVGVNSVSFLIKCYCVFCQVMLLLIEDLQSSEASCIIIILELSCVVVSSICCANSLFTITSLSALIRSSLNCLLLITKKHLDLDLVVLQHYLQNYLMCPLNWWNEE